MVVTERRERERQDVRAKILDAARELFAKDGYDAVTMREIAKRIEYSPTAIYLHFADKAALIRELCNSDFLALAQRFIDLMRVPDPIERIRRAGEAYIEFAEHNPNHYRLMFMTPMPAEAPTPAESTVQQGNPEEDAYAFLRGSVAEALAAGRFRPGLTDPDLISQVFWAGVHGIAALQVVRAEDPWVEWRPLGERTRILIDALIDGLTVRKG
jgi:AcrR family transcriptional regulator